MSEPEAPKIEFPCDYPIKVVGRAGDDFQQLVVDTVQRFCAPIDPKNVLTKPSSKGTFASVNITFTATGEPQIEDIFEALKATGRVSMVI